MFFVRRLSIHHYSRLCQQYDCSASVSPTRVYINFALIINKYKFYIIQRYISDLLATDDNDRALNGALSLHGPEVAWYDSPRALWLARGAVEAGSREVVADRLRSTLSLQSRAVSAARPQTFTALSNALSIAAEFRNGCDVATTLKFAGLNSRDAVSHWRRQSQTDRRRSRDVPMCASAVLCPR